MNDVNKNLGHATAYGYAKSKGYTGTEEEFSELMADYAEVGERAEQAATAAAASATAASGSASDSAASATAAEGFAGTASTAAGTASQAATTASGAATTATAKATEATTAATAAQTAQSAAESAQTAAQASAVSAAASAAQAAEDAEEISDVKSALGACIITDTASGAIATFPDGADDVPVESLTVTMEPIQDLHGQANPYPAGGGKNLAPFVEGINFTILGVTFTTQSGNLYINGTASNGISSASQGFKDNFSMTLTAGSYYYSWNNYPSGSGIVPIINKLSDNTNVLTGEGSFSLSEETTVYIGMYVPSGVSLSGIQKIQVEKGTAATAYAPYSNICPISGRTAVTVTRTGVNVWDEEWEVNTVSGQQRVCNKNPIPVMAGETYYIKTPEVAYFNAVSASGAYQSYIGYAKNDNLAIPIGVEYIAFSVLNSYGTTYDNNISINYPSTDHDYHPGTVASVEVQLGQTVYGGTVDVVTGTMVVDRAMVDLGTMYWSYITASERNYFVSNIQDRAVNSTMLCSLYPYMGNSTDGAMIDRADNTLWGNTNGKAIKIKALAYTDAASFNTAVTGQTLVYELAQPITITLTPKQLTTLLGQNNVWSDADSVSVEYTADTKLYIQKVIAAALA